MTPGLPGVISSPVMNADFTDSSHSSGRDLREQCLCGAPADEPSRCLCEVEFNHARERMGLPSYSDDLRDASLSRRLTDLEPSTHGE